VSKHPKSRPIKPASKVVREIPVSFKEKLVREGNSVVLKKEAVILPLRSRMDMLMMWSSEKKDIIGRWSWGQSRNWGLPLWRKNILPFLHHYEKKMWKDIHRENAGDDHRFKTYETSKICKEARERLVELKIDDLEDISRFRLGNRPRLYGIMCQHVFFLLWWDPEHNIYPSNIQARGKVRLIK
jgi:hypothetical protein